MRFPQLVGRPQVDDEAVIGYLYSRYRVLPTTSSHSAECAQG